MGSATIVMLGMIVISVVIVLANRAMHRREAERAEEYRKAAALRGWEMTFDGQEYRYSGSTEGVRWVAHVGYYRRRAGGNKSPKPLLWQTTAVTFDEGALVVWPDFGQSIQAVRNPGVPELILNLAMRPIAWALGVPGGDAATLARASEVVEGPPGYLYRATHAERMREWLDNGAAHSLQAEAGWLATQHTPGHLIVAVLWRYGLQIATPYGGNDLEQIARVARVGVRMANAAN